MIYFNDTFKGHYAVGTAAIVCEKTPDKAAAVLSNALKHIGLEQEVKPEDMKVFKSVLGNCVILLDGNY